MSALPADAGSPERGSAGLPEPLRRIAEEAARYAESEPARVATRAAWERQVALVRAEVPDAIVEDAGETVRVGELSPGCVACKAGTWDCVFVTMRCNLSCAFCLRPDGAEAAGPRGAFGGDPAASAAGYAAAGVTGVSFSGGEPFLEPEVVLRWATTLRQRLPGVYLWAYTNGALLSAGLLARLAESGLDELRFDLAATGYRDPAVLSMVRAAARALPAVAVEVPAIPADGERLLDSLEAWAELGVRYLNLHELVYEPGSASGRMAGVRERRTMPDGHACEVDPGSAALVREVLARVVADGLPIGVNDCSLRNKARQLRGRRAMLAPFTLQEHEVLRPDGLAESERALAGSGTEPRTARVLRFLPLEVGGRGQWVGFELVDAGEVRR